MSIDIYWISGSSPAWRVLLMLDCKNIPYTSHILENSKNQQKEPWFLALSPRGQIPLLKDGDLVISESLAIMHYLEKRYVESPMFGSSAMDTAKIEQCMHEILSYVDKPVGDFVQPVFRNKVEEHRHTLPDTAENIVKELTALETRLSVSNWLVGDFSAADIILTPTFQRLLRAINKAPELADEIGLNALDTQFPNLDRWNNNSENLPAFQKTFPPHWR